MKKPLHIGVVTGTGGQPLITAEYLTGYRVLGVYPSFKAAHEALPAIKRRMRELLAKQESAQ